MIDPAKQQIARSPRHRRSSTMTMSAAVAALALAASFIASAFAAGSAVTIGSAANSTLGEQVAVNSQGRTLYTLSPETTSHLLCKSSECLKFWPPLTVRSRTTKLKAGAGVLGRLGILRRSNGMLQVTLRGRPLYRYSGDHAKGQAGGQGIESFGGIWHAVIASSTTSSATPTTPPATPTVPTTPTTPGYRY